MPRHTPPPGIRGVLPLGATEYADLDDPIGSVVRIAPGHHGQFDAAGADLPVWLTDLWTGSACQPTTPNPNPLQPHRPVHVAATLPRGG